VKHCWELNFISVSSKMMEILQKIRLPKSYLLLTDLTIHGNKCHYFFAPLPVVHFPSSIIVRRCAVKTSVWWPYCVKHSSRFRTYGNMGSDSQTVLTFLLYFYSRGTIHYIVGCYNSKIDVNFTPLFWHVCRHPFLNER